MRCVNEFQFCICRSTICLDKVQKQIFQLAKMHMHLPLLPSPRSILLLCCSVAMLHVAGDVKVQIMSSSECQKVLTKHTWGTKRKYTQRQTARVHCLCGGACARVCASMQVSLTCCCSYCVCVCEACWILRYNEIVLSSAWNSKTDT